MGLAREVLFAPYDQVITPLLTRIATARSLHFMGFDLGLAPFVARVEAMCATGLGVQGGLDRSQTVQPWEAPLVARLRTAMGPKLVVGTSPVRGQISHTKLVICDKNWAWYGSANLTQAAGYEQNIVVIEHSAKGVAQLEAYFQRAWADMAAHP